MSLPVLLIAIPHQPTHKEKGAAAAAPGSSTKSNQAFFVAATNPAGPRNSSAWRDLAILKHLVAVIVGGCAALAALRTLKAIEKQGRHRTPNAERAKMMVFIQPIGHSLDFSTRNTGRAVARITYSKGFVSVLPIGQELPKKPIYLIGNQTPQ